MCLGLTIAELGACARPRELQNANCKLQIENCKFEICNLHFSICHRLNFDRHFLCRRAPLRFIHVLQRNGYGDMAVQYLEILAKRPDVPPEVRDVWDLEMSRSLRAEAATAFDAKDHDRLMEESQRYLAKFIREKPDNPATATATAAWGESLGKQALERIAAAKALPAKDKEKQQKALAEARGLLGQARDKFQQAQRLFKTRLDALPRSQDCPPTRPSGPKPSRPGASANSTWKTPNSVRRW